MLFGFIFNIVFRIIEETEQMRINSSDILSILSSLFYIILVLINIIFLLKNRNFKKMFSHKIIINIRLIESTE